MNEWKHLLAKERMNEYINDQKKEWIKTWIAEEWMNPWICKRKKMNTLINKRKNE